MTSPSPGPIPATVAPAEVAAVRAAWVKNRNDVGVGLYNPTTGEIHVGTYDTTALRIGHDGLQASFGIADVDRPHWRGFVFDSSGQTMNASGFNAPDGNPPRMRPDYFSQVEDALRRAGLA